jgi:hypothetical protein
VCVVGAWLAAIAFSQPLQQQLHRVRATTCRQSGSAPLTMPPMHLLTHVIKATVKPGTDTETYSCRSTVRTIDAVTEHQITD